MMSMIVVDSAMMPMHAEPTAAETATCDQVKAIVRQRTCHEGGRAWTGSTLESGCSTLTTTDASPRCHEEKAMEAH